MRARARTDCTGRGASKLGATLDIGVVWDVADTFNGLMVVPNLLGLFLLSGPLVRILRGDASREWRAAKS